MKARVFAALVIAATACTLQAQDADVEKALSKIAQLGEDVYKVKTDKQGRITSCIVVGQSRISTVLGRAKGLQDAQTKARLRASAVFVKWLKENVSVHVDGDGETINFLEGSKDNDAQALKEAGKAIEKTSEKFKSVSSGMVRGLQRLHVEISEKNETYTIVMGWSADTSRAIEKIEKGGDGKGAPKNKNSKKPGIGDKKVTSDDAKKFL